MADPQVVDYLKVSLAQGKSKEELYKELLGQGWTIDVIQESFKAVGATEEEKEDSHKRTVGIIVTIGAVLIGAGVFSFIAANWMGMTRPLKVVLILIFMAISYGAGWYLKEKYNFPKVGETLILLGAIIYGAGIFLVAQMFNIRANWPDGFILWMMGAVAMAFAAESFLLFYLAIPLGIVAILGHPLGIFTGFAYSPFMLTSSFLLLAATVLTFVTGWAIRKKMPPDLKEFY